MKNILTLTMTALFFVSFSSCSNNNSSNEVTSTASFSSYLTTYNFFCEGSLNESDTYSFNGGSFVLTKKDKRTGATRTFNGDYQVKSSKFSDKGTDFYYVTLDFDNKNYADKLFFVYWQGFIIKPSVADIYEDQYGIDIKEWHVSLALSYNKFSPIKK